MRIAIIGAGAGGLAAARRALATEGVQQVTVFEQADRLGGTWVYTERVGEDVSSSMYHDLITNGPKEIIGYADIPYDDPKLQSFIKSTDVLAYLERFAERFSLVPHIQFSHQVLQVRPIASSSRWSVTVRNLCVGTDSTTEYDAVMVCNGHHSVPAYPEELLGRDVFTGQQVHSHDFRHADAYAGKTVLVIGNGPSGKDIAWNVRPHAVKVCVSTHSQKATDEAIITFGAASVRPAVEALTATAVRFADGTEEQFDTILYCTGYLYRFPFLSDECNVTTADNHVRPLFKQCVHIEHPTLFLLGLTHYDLPFLVMDTQAQFCLALLVGKWKLPDRAEMLRIAEQDVQRCWDLGFHKRQAHHLRELMPGYVDDLVELANLEPLPPVLFKIFAHVLVAMTENWKNFRAEQYAVVDRENFTTYFLNDEEHA